MRRCSCTKLYARDDPLTAGNTLINCRERGNRLFQGGDYQAARDAYTASIAAAPGAPALSNRALMALKLRDWAAAELDASAAVDLDVGAWKAWQRRAAARLQLGSPEKVCVRFSDTSCGILSCSVSLHQVGSQTTCVSQSSPAYHLPCSKQTPCCCIPHLQLWVGVVVSGKRCETF